MISFTRSFAAIAFCLFCALASLAQNPWLGVYEFNEDGGKNAGGTPIFPELSGARLAKDRVVDPMEVVRRDPEIVFASWCSSCAAELSETRASESRAIAHRSDHRSVARERS